MDYASKKCYTVVVRCAKIAVSLIMHIANKSTTECSVYAKVLSVSQLKNRYVTHLAYAIHLRCLRSKIFALIFQNHLATKMFPFST